MATRIRNSFILAALLLLAVLFSGTLTANAETPAELANYSTVTATNINFGRATLYRTPVPYSYNAHYYYNIKVPAAGTVIITYYTFAGDGAIKVDGDYGGLLYEEPVPDSGIRKYFRFESAKTATLDITVGYPRSGSENAVAFRAEFVPNNVPTLQLGKTYYHASAANMSTPTMVKVNVPETGYLVFGVDDVYSSGTGFTQVATAGFKGYDLFSSDHIAQPIGVKKGIYTFYIKNPHRPAYRVNANFYKVKESKYGKTKKKAAKIKKKKYYDGIIVTDSKKVHWYKFKNPKKQKVTFEFLNKLSGGGNFGGIKVTFYYKNTKSEYKLTSAYSNVTITPYNVGKKLKKGTYYIKVESFDNGTGHFRFRWK